MTKLIKFYHIRTSEKKHHKAKAKAKKLKMTLTAIIRNAVNSIYHIDL